jgi:hypothetical protein
MGGGASRKAGGRGRRGGDGTIGICVCVSKTWPTTNEVAC